MYQRNGTVARGVVKVPVISLEEFDVPVPDEFRNSGGLILVEGRAAGPVLLKMIVRNKITEETDVRTLRLSLSPINKMMRVKNLRGDGSGWPDSSGQSPDNWPDSEIDTPGSPPRNLFFVHGYKADRADGTQISWLSEMFKNFFWSGSKGRFHGILWRSGEGRLTNFQRNAWNAFMASEPFSEYIRGVNDPACVIVAHSLGCLLVSEALRHGNLRFSKVYLCNGAVPTGAYQDDYRFDSTMIPEIWSLYNPRAWSTNWHDLPAAQLDWRKGLTWGGRYAGIAGLDGVENLFSNGDEVFELTDHYGDFAYMIFEAGTIISKLSDLALEGGRYAWQFQELRKGLSHDGIPGLNDLGTTEFMGWGIEPRAETIWEKIEGWYRLEFCQGTRLRNHG